LVTFEQWVEKGVALEGIVATKYTDDDLTQAALRTMPLCSFPRREQCRELCIDPPFARLIRSSWFC